MFVPTICQKFPSTFFLTEIHEQESCPPREVRAFRVLIVQDSRTCRRPANRTAQLTVWNIMSLALDEGSKPGGFAVGQRYLVSLHLPCP
jgi:breast cancer 2 susceptibility protein